MNESYNETYQVIGAIMAKYPTLTAEEETVLNEWMAKDGNKEIFESIVDNDTRLQDFKRFLEIKQQSTAAKERFDGLVAGPSEQPAQVIGWHKWQTYVAAASVIVLISLIGYKWFGEKKNDTQKQTPVVSQNNDVNPGQYKAKLTLADGSVLLVDSFSKDRLVQQGSTNVYNKDGKLVYKENGKAKSVLYNTLSTEKGQIYGMVLGDGTKVWLNSQSSIRYPVHFKGSERKVEITGEAYFDVTHNAAMPFHVLINGIDMQVLGTEFNVNGYNDEPEIKTTLLEGRVKVSKGNSVKILSPEQQATYNKETQQLDKVENVDVKEVVAWKNGYFQFKDADWQTLLRQIVRWYDVEVAFNGPIPQRKISGKIPRNSNLSQVLEALETIESFKDNQVHFKLEGKRIIVMP